MQICSHAAWFHVISPTFLVTYMHINVVNVHPHEWNIQIQSCGSSSLCAISFVKGWPSGRLLCYSSSYYGNCSHLLFLSLYECLFVFTSWAEWIVQMGGFKRREIISASVWNWAWEKLCEALQMERCFSYHTACHPRATAACKYANVSAKKQRLQIFIHKYKPSLFTGINSHQSIIHKFIEFQSFNICCIY